MDPLYVGILGYTKRINNSMYILDNVNTNNQHIM